MKTLSSFIIGSLAGAVTAALFTPTKGKALRQRIRCALRHNGILRKQNNADEFVDTLAAEF